MNTRVLDGHTFRRVLCGGAQGIRLHAEAINELNVFPVPDGDTGTNMTRTIEGGIAGISTNESATLGEITAGFAKGSLLGARGNSGVILSQFFAGLCGALSDKSAVTAEELAEAYNAGVSRAYNAVAKPVEGTILTVLRESAVYAQAHIDGDATVEDYLRLNIEEAERSLARTKEILPVLTEADVVDSGGAGYLCIAKGMYEALQGEEDVDFALPTAQETAHAEIDYDLFTTDSALEWGYCTECLVRLQRVKGDPSAFDERRFVSELEAMGCDSIVALRDGDILKVHAHTPTPSNILTLCQRYGEFLNVKIENMSLQHSEREAAAPKKKPRSFFGVVTVATGDGVSALFESLGADVVISGGQTGNPAAEEFLRAFETLNAEHILVIPNNSNILLTAAQAAQLWEGKQGDVTVVPTRTLPEGYAALSVFNAAIKDVDAQLSDMQDAIDAVVSGEITTAVRDTVIGGVEVKEGEYIGILDGELVISLADRTEALCGMIETIDDIDDRELLTLFVGDGVSDEARGDVTDELERRFPSLTVEVYIGRQQVYDYLIAVE